MKALPYCVALACASPLAGNAAPVNTIDPALEELVVTSSRVPMPLRKIGTSISVIEAEEISLLGYNSLADVLRSQPSVAVVNQGGAGAVTSLRIRGEQSYRTTVILDGIDITDTSAPQAGPRIEQILSAGVQRVEILRGPQGLMYGADAGGVVNITTTAPREGLTAQVSAEGGRYGSQQFTANVAGGNNVVDFNLSAADFATDGFNARSTDTTQRDDDGYENTTLHARLGWNVTDTLRLNLVVRDLDADNDYDDCFTVDTFANTNLCEDTYEQQAWRAQADYQAGRFTHQLFYSDSDIERAFYSEGLLSFSTDGGLEQTGYLGSFDGADALKLVYGVDLETESINDGSIDEERDQQGYYLEVQSDFSELLFITAGARYDDNDDFGSHTSYRVSAAYLMLVENGELKFRTTYGTGFRAPSLYEISYNDGPFSYAPAAETQLKEETSAGVDVGLSYTRSNGLFLEAVYFDQTVNDEIFFDLQDFSGYLQSNGDSRSRGVELIAEWPVLDGVNVNANYTYNDTEDESGDSRIFRPKHLANAGLTWRTLTDRLRLGINLRLSQDAVNSAGSSLDDYEIIELSASFDLTRGLQIYGRVENLLDEDYQEIPTYNTTGRAAYAGVRYTF
tara:strand:+ start:333564 stop:335429 length:1866 start_codon:yes stop_codon:yes gene_type:complete